MMNSCALKRESERALELFMEMQEKQLPLCEHTFTSLIRATSVRADMHERTFELMALYLASGHLPSEMLMCNVLYSCAQAGNVRSAHQIWNRLSDADPYNLYAMQPSRRMYTQLLKVYTRAIRHEAPLALARATSAEHRMLSYKDLGRIVMEDAGDLGELAELTREDKALKDAQDLLEKEKVNASSGSAVTDPSATQLSLNPKPNVASLLKFVDTAVSRMKADGSGHDIYSVNALIEAYSWSYQLDKSLDLLRNLEALTGVKPNTECYRAVISCAVALKRMNTAFDLYEEYLEKRIAPVPFGQDPYAKDAWDRVPFVSAEKSDTTSGSNTDTGESTLATTTQSNKKRVVQKGAHTDVRCTPGYLKMHLSLINGCAEAGAFQKAVELVQHLCDNRGTPKPNYMMKLRKLAFEMDATEYWDQAKALCLKNDLDNDWAVTDIRYKDAFKKWKPPKLKFYEKRQQMPGHYSDLAWELNPKPEKDPNIEPRRQRERVERRLNPSVGSSPYGSNGGKSRGNSSTKSGPRAYGRTTTKGPYEKSGRNAKDKKGRSSSAKERKKRDASLTAYERTVR
ncbi:hypothetical protein SARC_09470 [Sphaeroforma arctica JP610]|uniref:PROP1-like PPR domain-containing protein n=1 Tax=Sphaeroforma arctica JP610 TaxID=667725 RepID=A0A0L0FMW3_9EUKA|nr:hypothetical protein SARC_09470 [Sphaeroforma arctica JP610]KNC78084.1 hypothetical protein SARC_09470 [Sphaeroforma arctica JP610]|eukprot:XP_014151986.1 hypothetical protein SARC_09470 [Sphaeroforma arctica JP610]